MPLYAEKFQQRGSKNFYENVKGLDKTSICTDNQNNTFLALVEWNVLNKTRPFMTAMHNSYVTH